MKFSSTIAMFTLLSISSLSLAEVKNNANQHENSQECSLWPSQHQKELEKILGHKATIYPDEGVVKFTLARPHVQMHIKSQPLDPFMSSQTWFSFQKGLKPGVETMMMGHLALKKGEINPAIDAALANNIDITSLHTHIFSDKPGYFLHVNAEGSLKAIANGVKQILLAKKQSPRIILPVRHSINGKQIEAILQTSGHTENGMFKIEIGRLIQASCGCPIGKSMGVNSWATFGGTNAQAVVNGDIVATEHELQGILKALRAGNIHITAIHNHMLGESPRLVFVHYMGAGKAEDLAKTVKNALNQMKMSEKAECKTCPRK